MFPTRPKPVEPAKESRCPPLLVGSSEPLDDGEQGRRDVLRKPLAAVSIWVFMCRLDDARQWNAGWTERKIVCTLVQCWPGWCTLTFGVINPHFPALV